MLFEIEISVLPTESDTETGLWKVVRICEFGSLGDEFFWRGL